MESKIQENNLIKRINVSEHSNVCPVCEKPGKDDMQMTSFLALEKSKFKVVRCCFCLTAWLEPQPSQKEINNLYDNKYFQLEELNYSYKEQLESTYSCFVENAKTFRQLLGYEHHILDIGSATGEFLQAIKNEGLNATGIEISEYACDIARKKGLSVHQGDLFLPELDSMRFSGVHISHVFEHLPDPVKFLSRLSELVIEQGVIYIEVPYQFNSFLDILNRLFKRHKPIYGPFSIHHLYFYNLKSLENLLKKHGFEIIDTTTYLPCRRSGTPSSIKKSILSVFLYLSDKIFKRGDVISLWLRKAG